MAKFNYSYPINWGGIQASNIFPRILPQTRHQLWLVRRCRKISWGRYLSLNSTSVNGLYRARNMVQPYNNFPFLDCADCGSPERTATRFSMPLTHLGDKKYYLGIFFKVSDMCHLSLSPGLVIASPNMGIISCIPSFLTHSIHLSILSFIVIYKVLVTNILELPFSEWQYLTVRIFNARNEKNCKIFFCVLVLC